MPMNLKHSEIKTHFHRASGKVHKSSYCSWNEPKLQSNRRRQHLNEAKNRTTIFSLDL